MFEPIQATEIFEAPNENIKKFATLPMHEALKYVRCGFELETQSVFGREIEDMEGESYISKKNLNEIIAYFISKKDCPQFFKNLVFKSATARYCSRDMLVGEDTYGMSPLKISNICLKRGLTLDGSSIVPDEQDEDFRNIVIEMSESYHYFEGIESLLEDIHDSRRMDWRDNIRTRAEDKGIHISDLIDMGEDGSVKGCEFRTYGACTVNQFCKAADSLFNIPMDIDEECSFHIHLSIDGVNHSYGRSFQQCMLSYLADHYNELPRSVKERLENEDWVDQYFAIDTGDAKYKAVAYRGQTWEFRLFGNVQNARDAKKCLLLAIRAIRHAYRAKYIKQQKENSFQYKKEMHEIKQIRRRMQGSISHSKLAEFYIQKLEAKKASTKKEMGRL
jgi:hypothetical protein